MRLTNKNLLLAVLGLLLAILIGKIALFVTARPNITVNYVAEYNRMSRPQDYDPNDNAAPYYQAAFDRFVDMPGELRWPQMTWTTDFNDADRAVLTQWLTSNSQAFEHFKEALNKPYYWLERKAAKDNIVAQMMVPELTVYRELTNALIWEAKLVALEGWFHTAFENILYCYRAGDHKCRPNLLLSEQLTGLRIKQDAARNALIMLDKSRLDNSDLKYFQDALYAESKNNYVPSFQAERLLLCDALQRLYIDDGKGTGRLAWSVGWYITPRTELDKSDLQRKCENLKRRLYYCLIGPTRNEIVGQIEKVLTISDQIMPKTPWQIKNEAYGYFDEIENINNSNWLLQVSGVSPKSTFDLYHKTRAQTEALIAIIGTLRYKIDTGQFPETLDGLVSSGYLQAVPNDPYSSGPLVYKRTAGGFKLYSIGADFSDNAGTTIIEQPTRFLGPRMPLPATRCADIVYWPIQQRGQVETEGIVTEPDY